MASAAPLKLRFPLYLDCLQFRYLVWGNVMAIFRFLINVAAVYRVFFRRAPEGAIFGLKQLSLEAGSSIQVFFRIWFKHTVLQPFRDSHDDVR